MGQLLNAGWHYCTRGGCFQWYSLTSRAAAANFGLFNEAVSGRSDFIIQGICGQPLNQKQLRTLAPLTHSQDWHILPVVKAMRLMLMQQVETCTLALIGLDLIALGNLPEFNELGLSFSASQSEDSEKWYQWLQPASGIWLTHALVERCSCVVLRSYP